MNVIIFRRDANGVIDADEKSFGDYWRARSFMIRRLQVDAYALIGAIYEGDRYVAFGTWQLIDGYRNVTVHDAQTREVSK